MIGGGGGDVCGGIISAEADAQIQRLSQDVTTLKNDKLDLLRQNVVSSQSKTFSCINWLVNTLLFSAFRLASVKSNTCASTNSRCKAIWQRLAKRFCDYAICSTHSIQCRQCKITATTKT